MQFLRWTRALGLLAALSAALTAAGTAAPATQIVGIRIDSQPNGGTAVVIQFNGQPPQITPVGIGSAQVTLLVPNVSSGPLVPPMTTASGPIQSVAITQSGGNASIFIRLATPQFVRFRAVGQVVILDVPPANPGNLLLPNAAAPPSSGSPPAAGLITVVVPLKYADISEVAGVLVQGANVASNDVFNPISTNIGTSQLNGSFGGVTGGFQTNTAQQSFGGGSAFGGGGGTGLAQRLNDSIAVDRRLNAIILTGTPDTVEAYKSTIEKLDVALPSVILETEIVELDENAAENIGIDYSPGGTGIIVSGAPSGGTTTTGGVQNGLVITTGQKAQGQVSLAANIYAQVTKGDGKVIAKPRILAQSGQQASILTGDAIPIITSVVVTGSSSLTSQQVSYVNVGVDLQILPRVSSDGYVTSHIYSEVSSVTAYVQGIPQISQRTASTSATVKDGESFVIGGLLEDNEIKNLQKVPFVGDLPLIGVFFRYLSTSHTQSNLYIVVTPHIVGNIAHPPGPQPYAPQPVVPTVSPPPATPAPSATH